MLACSSFRRIILCQSLYAIGLALSITVSLKELSSNKAQVSRVTLLATGQPLTYQQTPEALKLNLPPQLTAPYVLKNEGTQNLSARLAAQPIRHPRHPAEELLIASELRAQALQLLRIPTH